MMTKKLTENQVLEMRRKYRNGGFTYLQLGKEYGISGNHAGRVVKKKHYKFAGLK